jgi:hypothetical protein
VDLDLEKPIRDVHLDHTICNDCDESQWHQPAILELEQIARGIHVKAHDFAAVLTRSVMHGHANEPVRPQFVVALSRSSPKLETAESLCSASASSALEEHDEPVLMRTGVFYRQRTTIRFQDRASSHTVMFCGGQEYNHVTL